MISFENKSARCLPWIVSFLFFASLWSLDFPKPYFDDLFFCGAGLNMAGGGDFSNPLIERQHFPGHYFFEQTPVHSYAIAGWMKIFGIGARSLTGFQEAMYLVMALATLAVLRRHKAPLWLEFLVPLGVAAAFLPMGLRPEPLSVALTMAGFAMIECGCCSPPPVFIAFLLMFVGGATAPRLTVFSGALAVLGGLRLWRNSSAPGWRRWSFCFYGMAALLVAVFIFLLLIGFRFEEFWRCFHFHAAYKTGGGRLHLLAQYFFENLGKTQLPLFFMAPVVLLFALRHRNNESFRLGAFLAAAFLLTALIGGLGHGSAWYAVLMMFFLAASISNNTARHKIILPAALSLVLLVAAGKCLMNVAGVLGGEIQKDRGVQYAEALQLRSTPEHPVLVDFALARYVYDYRIPPGFLAFEFSAPFPGVGVKDYFQVRDIYVVSPESVDYLNRWTKLDVPWMPQWSFCNVARLPLLSRWTLYQHPCSVNIIPAETCGGLALKK